MIVEERNVVTLAVVQAELGADVETNVGAVETLVREAAARGAHIVATPELFEAPYFPKVRSAEYFAWARPRERHPTIERFRRIARELAIVVPVSFFERDGEDYYNTVAVLGPDGTVLGFYRKSHIPDGPGYDEKFYFRLGDTGFRVWPTPYGTVGVGICWDQWFPECARAMVLQGAEFLLYPTAIGSEPAYPDLDTRGPWQRVMIGHAVANVVPVAAANRIGDEDGQRFYGSSFICDHRGEKLAELGTEQGGVALATFDRARLAADRELFALLRDRRPDLYGGLCRDAG